MFYNEFPYKLPIYLPTYYWTNENAFSSPLLLHCIAYHGIVYIYIECVVPRCSSKPDAGVAVKTTESAQMMVLMCTRRSSLRKPGHLQRIYDLK